MKRKSEILLTTILFIVMTSTGIAHADLSGSSVTAYTPQPIPAATFDFIIEVTMVSNDGEFVDRFQITLPAGWTINSLTAPPVNSNATCPGVSTQTTSSGQTAIWEITGGYAGGSTCGPWKPGLAPGTVFSFVVNVTVPNCSARPWTMPWAIYGDQYGMAIPPHNIISNISINSCVEPTIASADSYSFTIIDHPNAMDGGGTVITGMNDNGWVIGYYRATGSIDRGFLYDGTTFTPIDYPGAVETLPFGINNSNQIVGFYQDGGVIIQGFTYNDGIYSAPINHPGSSGTFLFDINDDSHISASYLDATRYHGFYLVGSTANNITYPGSSSLMSFSMLNGINNNDKLVGFYIDATGVMHGFLHNHSTFNTISYPGSFGTRARDISDNGIIAGNYEDNDGKQHGFLFDGVSTYKRIDYPGSLESRIFTVNRKGDIAGSYQDHSGTEHGYLAREFSWIHFYPAIIKQKQMEK